MAHGLGIAFRWVLEPSRDFVGEMHEWMRQVKDEWIPRPEPVRAP